MADNNMGLIANSGRGLMYLPVLKQIGLMTGFAALIALFVALVLWAREPTDYRILFNNLNDSDAASIVDVLSKSDIPSRLSSDGSTVLVPGSKIHDARMIAAGQSLPKTNGAGFESLMQEQGFGVSQFMENARYQRALESELAKTIGTLSSVQSARVHLAVPKESAFIRDRNRKKASASVMVNLHAGRSLEDEQISAIAHMVSSSVPGLEIDQVTIIDQKGRLLTSPYESEGIKLTTSQFEFRKKVEDYYIKRIESILGPIIGSDGVRAQVTAEIDQNIIEQTQESFNPDLPAVRSEQTIEEKTTNGGSQQAIGIPGATSNQPPVNGAVAQNNNAQPNAGEAQPQNSVVKSTRNYELDRTISHTRQTGGNIKRLSVAVVIDDKKSLNEDGEAIREPYSEDDIARFIDVVKEAIGYNELRGDKVIVKNISFSVVEEPIAEVEPSLLDKPWIGNVLKSIAAGVLIMVIVLMVIRPIMRSLAEKGAQTPQFDLQNLNYAMTVGGEVPPGVQQQMMGRLPGPMQYDQQLTAAKNLATQDSRRVANVVKGWVATDG